jgi:hypothetical protein
MLLVNPKINGASTSVPNILNALNRKATSLTVKGTIPIPPWSSLNPADSIAWHYQGIAPYNGNGGPTIGNGVISASSTQGYFSGFSQAQNANPAVRSVVVPNSSYYHLAGIQMLGDVLPAPLESKTSSENGLVVFYNVGNLASPVKLYTLTMPARKASATAITTYTDSSGVEQCMLMVYEYDHQQMYIYQALASAIPNGNAVWTLVTTYTGSAFQTGDEYQSFALVTQTNGTGVDTVYLLGFREDEELWLWTVNTTVGSSYGTPTLVTHYTGWNGSDWRNGMGVEIASTTVMRLFGTDKDPSGSSTYPGGPANYHFDIWIYQ